VSRARTLCAVDVEFEFDDTIYVFSEASVTRLGENLRNYAAGTFPKDVPEITGLPGVAPDWLDGTRALADAIEATLTGARTGPVPLGGKTAAAAHAALLPIVRVGDPPDGPPGPDALLTALRNRLRTSGRSGGGAVLRHDRDR
jgi:hypothetical protein